MNIHADPLTGDAYEGANPPARFSVPLADSAAYSAWYAAQNFPPPPVVPVVPQVPGSVSLKQFRKALMRNGLSPTSLNQWIDANITDPLANFDAHEDLEYSNMVERDNEFLNQMAVALGQTQEWVNELFILADSLK